jgi:hypothetical protein
MYLRARFAVFVLFVSLVSYNIVSSQSLTSGTITGRVADPTGAVVSGASVEIANPVSGYKQSATTDSSGAFSFKNLPFNPYHLQVSANGFQATGAGR